MSARIEFKRGDDFVLEGRVTDGDAAQDISAWQIRSQIRDVNGALVAELGLQRVDDAGGVYRLTKAHDAADQPTTGWPVRELRCDIEYRTAAGQVVSTETFLIVVHADVTQ
jgi:hypothetical protein